ncbi:MAG: aminotransferase class I/II-fold pyridoxal phosphate-dependent enzyme [Pseudomonadota bacterium]
MEKIDTFFENCKASSAKTFNQFEVLLTKIEQNQQSKKETVEWLNHIWMEWMQLSPLEKESLHFDCVEQPIMSSSMKRLRLINFPSTYTPEDWSFTFYEGLSRYHADEFTDKNLVEIGCGNGWITLAIALEFKPAKIIGLDINPKAVTAAKLNLWLNAIDENGHFVYDQQGMLLSDRVEFLESDVLSAIKERQWVVDRIIGCIPQVLRPRVDMLQQPNNKIGQQNDEFLYSLSNYYEEQGYIEDEFGLGLIAKAVEESIAVIRPTGKIVLNLGGRPSRKILENLLERRGFQVKSIWSTKVEQAADTDILRLVEVEEQIEHRFEFYMSPSSDVPVNAKTAYSYAKKGGKIYHSVIVYEAVMKYPTWTQKIFTFLQQEGNENLKKLIDLTGRSEAVMEERLSFLADICQRFSQLPQFPYAMTQGVKELRVLLSRFFRSYYQVPVDTNEILVAPTRKDIIHNLISCFSIDLILVHSDLYIKYFASSSKKSSFSKSEVIEAPPRIDLTIELIQTLKPNLVLTQVESFESYSPDTIQRLIDVTAGASIPLILDISSGFEMSSAPKISGTFEVLSKEWPSHVFLLCGLIKNQAYDDLHLAFLCCRQEPLRKILENYAELTYSRAPYITQLYYAHILRELLFFHRPIDELKKTTKVEKHNNLLWSLNTNVAKAFRHPSIQGNLLPFDKESIRLDYGENELESPPTFKNALFESFARNTLVTDSHDLNSVISALWFQRFEFRIEQRQLFFTQGVSSLFYGLMHILKENDWCLCLPQGSYGYFVATALAVGVEVTWITTSPADNFMLTPEILKQTLDKIDNACVFLNVPINNPTGMVYSAENLKSLLTICQQQAAAVVCDTIFSGLMFENERVTDLQSLFIQNNIKCVPFILGGLSKEFAAGGLRFGFGYCPVRQYRLQWQSLSGSSPHHTLKFAVMQTLQAILKEEASMLASLQKQKQCLNDRAKRLTQVLAECGWSVIEPQGGLFLVARPTLYLNENKNINAETITEQLFQKVNVSINSDKWTGLKDYCRFVISVDEKVFEEGLNRIKSFHKAYKK